jgi:Lar family restriction alleviation protein
MSPIEPLLTLAQALNVVVREPLAPCPFCGSTQVTLYGAQLFRSRAVLCLGCAARGPEAATGEEAAHRWRERMQNDRAQARRVFEETIAKVMAEYAPAEDVLVEAKALDATGQMVVVARYKIHVDGRIECFEVLDEVLWPNV